MLASSPIKDIGLALHICYLVRLRMGELSFASLHIETGWQVFLPNLRGRAGHAFHRASTKVCMELVIKSQDTGQPQEESR